MSDRETPKPQQSKGQPTSTAHPETDERPMEEDLTPPIDLSPDDAALKTSYDDDAAGEPEIITDDDFIDDNPTLNLTHEMTVDPAQRLSGERVDADDPGYEPEIIENDEFIDDNPTLNLTAEMAVPPRETPKEGPELAAGLFDVVDDDDQDDEPQSDFFLDIDALGQGDEELPESWPESWDDDSDNFDYGTSLPIPPGSVKGEAASTVGASAGPASTEADGITGDADSPSANAEASPPPKVGAPGDSFGDEALPNPVSAVSSEPSIDSDSGKISPEDSFDEITPEPLPPSVPKGHSPPPQTPAFAETDGPVALSPRTETAPAPARSDLSKSQTGAPESGGIETPENPRSQAPNIVQGATESESPTVNAEASDDLDGFDDEFDFESVIDEREEAGAPFAVADEKPSVRDEDDDSGEILMTTPVEIPPPSDNQRRAEAEDQPDGNADQQNEPSKEPSKEPSGEDDESPLDLPASAVVPPSGDALMDSEDDITLDLPPGNIVNAREEPVSAEASPDNFEDEGDDVTFDLPPRNIRGAEWVEGDSLPPPEEGDDDTFDLPPRNVINPQPDELDIPDLAANIAESAAPMAEAPPAEFPAEAPVEQGADTRPDGDAPPRQSPDLPEGDEAWGGIPVDDDADLLDDPFDLDSVINAALGDEYAQAAIIDSSRDGYVASPGTEQFDKDLDGAFDALAEPRPNPDESASAHAEADDDDIPDIESAIEYVLKDEEDQEAPEWEASALPAAEVESPPAPRPLPEPDIEARMLMDDEEEDDDAPMVLGEDMVVEAEPAGDFDNLVEEALEAEIETSPEVLPDAEKPKPGEELRYYDPNEHETLILSGDETPAAQARTVRQGVLPDGAAQGFVEISGDDDGAEPSVVGEDEDFPLRPDAEEDEGEDIDAAIEDALQDEKEQTLILEDGIPPDPAAEESPHVPDAPDLDGDVELDEDDEDVLDLDAQTVVAPPEFRRTGETSALEDDVLAVENQLPDEDHGDDEDEDVLDLSAQTVVAPPEFRKALPERAEAEDDLPALDNELPDEDDDEEGVLDLNAQTMVAPPEFRGGKAEPSDAEEGVLVSENAFLGDEAEDDGVLDPDTWMGAGTIIQPRDAGDEFEVDLGGEYASTEIDEEQTLVLPQSQLPGMLPRHGLVGGLSGQRDEGDEDEVFDLDAGTIILPRDVEEPDDVGEAPGGTLTSPDEVVDLNTAAIHEKSADMLDASTVIGKEDTQTPPSAVSSEAYPEGSEYPSGGLLDFDADIDKVLADPQRPTDVDEATEAIEEAAFTGDAEEPEEAHQWPAADFLSVLEKEMRPDYNEEEDAETGHRAVSDMAIEAGEDAADRRKRHALHGQAGEMEDMKRLFKEAAVNVLDEQYFSMGPDKIEAVLERVIEHIFTDRFEKLFSDAVERAVHAEMRQIRKEVFERFFIEEGA